MDLIDLTRLATLAVMPLSLGLGLVLLALVALIRRNRGTALACLTLALLLVLPLSLPVVSNALIGPLEMKHPPTDPARCEKAEAIVVLGGAVRPRLLEDPFPRWHQGTDRVSVAAALYRARCAPVIFVAAGGKNEPPVIESEALAIRVTLARLGVPETAILHEEASRNTGQNAAEVWRSLSGQGVKRILLVTSAWHLPRAVAEFEIVGFEVSPFGSDYRAYLSGAEPLGGWWPDAGALMLSSMVFREYLGALIAPLRR